MKTKHIALFIVALLAIAKVQAQAPCASLLSDQYVSDGQYYSATLEIGEVKKSKITLIAGNEYRMIICPHNASKVNFRLIDQEGHELYNNKKYNFTNYWNFQVKETMICSIELSLEGDVIESDDIIMLIGFKK